MWVVLPLVSLFVSNSQTLQMMNILIFVAWAALPFAMAFDAGIVRMESELSISISILLVLLAAVPLIAPLGGILYIAYRSRVLSSATTQ